MCSYQDVLDHLNLTRDNGLYSLSRPVLDHTQTTLVELDVILYAILAVVGPASAAGAAVLLNLSDVRARVRLCVLPGGEDADLRAFHLDANGE